LSQLLYVIRHSQSRIDIDHAFSNTLIAVSKGRTIETGSTTASGIGKIFDHETLFNDDMDVA
jgi:hypothetical protein